MLKSCLERLDRCCAIDLGDELQKQSELADLNCLLHDVDAIQVIEDDRLQHEVSSVRMLGYAL